MFRWLANAIRQSILPERVEKGIPAIDSKCDTIDLERLRAEIIDFINGQRAYHGGLKPLVESHQLSLTLSQPWADVMACVRKYGHEDIFNSRLVDFFPLQGARLAMRSWETLHLSKMLHSRWRSIGIGLAMGGPDVFVCVDFDNQGWPVKDVFDN